jgi:hypothetical protein
MKCTAKAAAISLPMCATWENFHPALQQWRKQKQFTVARTGAITAVEIAIVDRCEYNLIFAKNVKKNFENTITAITAITAITGFGCKVTR